MLLILAWCAWPAHGRAQEISVAAADGLLKVRAPTLDLLAGEPLARLKDGALVRIEIEIAVLPRPDASPLAAARQTYALSYDLWEERFAVTDAASPGRSISHLTRQGAVAWCLDSLAVPTSALRALGRDQPFWIRLEYRILDGDRDRGRDEVTDFTLRGLIDTLSRRRKDGETTRQVHAGPFRLPR